MSLIACSIASASSLRYAIVSTLEFGGNFSLKETWSLWPSLARDCWKGVSFFGVRRVSARLSLPSSIWPLVSVSSGVFSYGSFSTS